MAYFHGSFHLDGLFPWELSFRWPISMGAFVLDGPTDPPKTISDSSHSFGTPKTPKSGPLGNWPKNDQFSIEIDYILTRKNYLIFFGFFERNNKWLREAHLNESFVQMASGDPFPWELSF